MEQYLAGVNSMTFYAIVAAVLGFITVMCFVFLVKSYKAGVAIGMDPKVLKKTITASATFTLLPSISILLGVPWRWRSIPASSRVKISGSKSSKF